MTIETTFILDHIYLKPLHLRPRPFETCSFETTFIWDHIHFISRQSEAVLIYSTTFLLSTFHFLVGNLTFCKVYNPAWVSLGHGRA